MGLLDTHSVYQIWSWYYQPLHKYYRKKNKFLGTPLAHGHALFFVWVAFYDGPWQTPPACNFEVDTFSRCRNIKGKPPILRSFPSSDPRPLFLWVLHLWWALANPNCVPNSKSLALAVVEILKGNRKILGSSHRPEPRALFFCVRFYDGPCRTQTVYQIWSR